MLSEGDQFSLESQKKLLAINAQCRSKILSRQAALIQAGELKRSQADDDATEVDEDEPIRGRFHVDVLIMLIDNADAAPSIDKRTVVVEIDDEPDEDLFMPMIERPIPDGNLLSNTCILPS